MLRRTYRTFFTLLIVFYSFAVLAVPTTRDVASAMQRGDYRTAEQLMQQIVNLNPLPKNHYALAQIMVKNGHISDARSELAIAETLDPTDSFAKDYSKLQQLKRDVEIRQPPKPAYNQALVQPMQAPTTPPTSWITVFAWIFGTILVTAALVYSLTRWSRIRTERMRAKKVDEMRVQLTEVFERIDRSRLNAELSKSGVSEAANLRYQRLRERYAAMIKRLSVGDTDLEALAGSYNDLISDIGRFDFKVVDLPYPGKVPVQPSASASAPELKPTPTADRTPTQERPRYRSPVPAPVPVIQRETVIVHQPQSSSVLETMATMAIIDSFSHPRREVVVERESTPVIDFGWSSSSEPSSSSSIDFGSDSSSSSSDSIDMGSD